MSGERRRRRRLGKRVNRATLALLAALVVLLGVLWWALAFLSPDTSGRQLTLDQVDALVGAQRVRTATVLDEDSRITGLLGPARNDLPEGAKPVNLAPGRYWVAYPQNDSTLTQLITKLTASGARLDVDPQSSKALVRLVTTTLLPLVVLANLFALFFTAGRGASAGIGEVLDFSRIPKDGSRRGRMVTFNDAAGVDEAVVELREVVDYLSNPQKYAALSAAPPKGVLLFGPPGCGKTLLARAVAGEARVPFFSVAGAEFVESLVGVGAARVRDLFARVREGAPAIVFIDELDAAGRRRGGGASGGGSEEREQTLNQLLVEMDGFEVSSGIVVMAATNRPDMLDPALLRPGRFDRHISIDRPDRERRRAILEVHARQRPLSPDVDLDAVARQTPGFTGADLANVMNEAALLTLRLGETEIGQPSVSEAVQRVLGGPQRRGHVLDVQERARVAYHEAGHAIAAALTGRAGDVHRVSIVARGSGLGGVTLGREEDRVVMTRTQLRARMATALAGRVAEDLVFREPSTGADDDLETATAIARDMLGRHGMSDELGLARLVAVDADQHLGVQAGVGDIAPQTHAAYDRAVSELLEDVRTETAALLRTHRDTLERLARRLLRVESLEGAELQALLPRPGRPATDPAPEREPRPEATLPAPRA